MSGRDTRVAKRRQQSVAGGERADGRHRVPAVETTSRLALPRREVGTLLACYARDRDRETRDALFAEFLPLAHKLARRYSRSTETSDDLSQVAGLGLLKAIERYDPGHEASFMSFAVPTILGELRRHFRDSTWAIHVPRRAQERLRPLDQANSLLTVALGRSPTVDELAAELDWTVDEVLDGLLARRAYGAESLESMELRDGAGDGTGMTLLDVVGALDANYEWAEDQATLRPVIAALPERERWILHLRYIREMTQSAIATEVGVSQMQVSRILARTIEHVRREVEDADPEQ